jgi:nucleoside-diphosphate-sugar epimerase
LAVAQGGIELSRTYLVSDGEDLSTGERVRRLALALGVAPRLFRAPESALRYGLSMAGKRNVLDRIVGSLRIDASLVRRELGWSPPCPVGIGLARTARWFNERP